MIDAFRQHLFAAWAYAARLLGANRRRHSTFGPGVVDAAIAIPVLAIPARVVARAPMTAQTLGYRELEQMRRHYATRCR